MDPAAAPLLEALAARGDAPFLIRHDREVSGAAVAEAVRALREDPKALPPELQPGPLVRGDVVALRGDDLLLKFALPLALWSRGACVQFVGARETRSSVDGLLLRAGACFMILRDERGCFGGLPLAGRTRLAAGTLLATSGSGAKPKLVYHRLEKHLEAARAASAFLDLGPQDRLLLSLPTWHVGGLSMLFRALASQAALCIPSSGMPLRAALAHFEPTQVSLVATQLKRLLDDDDAVAHLRACRTVLMGGGPTPAALRAEALDAGIPLAVGYGATETCAFVAATRDPALVRMEDVAGAALPGRAIVLEDAGRIAIESPTLLDGYLEQDGLVSPLDAAGRWPSGDVGTLDDGVLHVHGRADRVFISGGENVQPEEIEEALLALAGVEEAVVVPVPDAEFGQRPVAFVRGHALDAATLDAALRLELAGFKTPDRYYRMPDRPTGALKPDLRMLAAMAKDALAAANLERL